VKKIKSGEISARGVKNFHNVGLWRVLGLGWESGGKLNGGEIKN
jgi:hypothetical protein